MEIRGENGLGLVVIPLCGPGNLSCKDLTKLWQRMVRPRPVRPSFPGTPLRPPILVPHLLNRLHSFNHPLVPPSSQHHRKSSLTAIAPLHALHYPLHRWRISPSTARPLCLCPDPNHCSRGRRNRIRAYRHSARHARG